MPAIRLSPQFWKQGPYRLSNVPNDSNLQLCATPELPWSDVDLGNADVRRNELLVREVRPEHQKHLAGVHRRVARRKADEPG